MNKPALELLDGIGDPPAQSAEPTVDVSAHVAEMSEPQPHAIAQEESRTGADSFSAVDNAGVPFDPAIHAKGFDGKGILTAKGVWRKRRGISGDAAGSGSRHRSFVGASTSAPAAGVVDEAAKARAAGIAAAQTLLMLAGAIGGPEWRPIVNEQENEQAQMEEVWGNYFVAKGVTDFPPGLALSIYCVGYSARRLTMPVTQSRAQKLKEWIGGKIGRWKARRAAKRAGLSKPTGVMSA